MSTTRERTSEVLIATGEDFAVLLNFKGPQWLHDMVFIEAPKSVFDL